MQGAPFFCTGPRALVLLLSPGSGEHVGLSDMRVERRAGGGVGKGQFEEGSLRKGGG